jgi:hypothetical protein
MEEWSRVVERLAQKRNKCSSNQDNFVFELTGQKRPMTMDSTDMVNDKQGISMDKRTLSTMKEREDYVQQHSGNRDKYRSLQLGELSSKIKPVIVSPKVQHNYRQHAESGHKSNLQKEKESPALRVLELSNYTYSKTSGKEPSESTLRSLPVTSERSPGSVFGYFKRAGTSVTGPSSSDHMIDLKNKPQKTKALDLHAQGVLIRQELQMLGARLRANMHKEDKHSSRCIPTIGRSTKAEDFHKLKGFDIERFDEPSESDHQDRRRSKSIENSLIDIRESIKGIKANLQPSSNRVDNNYISVRRCLDDRMSMGELSQSSNSQYYLMPKEWPQGNSQAYFAQETQSRMTIHKLTAPSTGTPPESYSPGDHSMNRVSVSKFNNRIEDLGSTKATLCLTKEFDPVKQIDGESKINTPTSS